jgi:hypothetical protein
MVVIKACKNSIHLGNGQEKGALGSGDRVLLMDKNKKPHGLLIRGAYQY